MSRRSLVRLSRDRRGAAALEFALIAPAFCMTMMGAFDVAHQLYVRAVLQGSVQKAARDSSLEAGTEQQVRDRLDAALTSGAKNLAKNVDPQITRRFYRTFADASAKQAEPFPGGNDTNGNGKCDAGEAFVDLNRNGFRDLDGGDGGQGTALDKTILTVKVRYPHLFPIWKFIGGTNYFDVSATTVLANQPYSDQASYSGSTDGHCRP